MSDISDPNSLFDDDSMEDSSGVMDDLSSGDSLGGDFDESGESVGMTSDESASDDGDSEESKKGLAFSVYDAMLCVAFVLVTLATVRMIWELSTFGPLPPSGFPWRVNL